MTPLESRSNMQPTISTEQELLAEKIRTAPIDQPLTPEANIHVLTPEEECGRLRDEMRARGESVFDRDVLPDFALG
jgi:hypothetical protein